MSLSRGRHRFHGEIAGVGSSSGVRVVVGHWRESPLGTFADVMLSEPDGTRVLLAPEDAVADFVSTTYRFDRVEIGPVDVAIKQASISGRARTSLVQRLRIRLGQAQP